MRRKQGFTIVELMITIGILAILAAIALPNYRNLVLRNAVEKTRDDLYADLVLARSEALARSRHVTICPVRDLNAALPQCNGVSWNDGWVIFQHVDPANNDQPAAEGDLIRVHSNLSSASTAIAFTGADQRITLDRMGRVQNNPGGVGDFGVCNTDIGFNTAISINISGRPSNEMGDPDLCD